ncbi:hypothetical protein GWI33_004205 [Rhynchophorus ferrugineus]|uniref:Ionotropic glutamate receptor C-terminal domain-containing protein n=1 Tax=Rhynchophorus ferrugineus TaxID=354439 RepID=A0A834MN12_RHYFE|nr:hypothetical protein GWI33_004205 [Rhynchophorus ferrugineus]
MRFERTFLSTIIKQYFLTTQCLFFLSDIDNVIDVQTAVPTVQVRFHHRRFKDTTKVMFNNFGCQDFIIKSSHPLLVFRYIENEIKLHSERFNKRKYVFLQGDINKQNIMDIFEMKEIEYVADLVVISRYMDAPVYPNILDKSYIIYDIWTHKYTGDSTNREVLHLNKWFSWNRTFLCQKDIFPDKLRDQEGRIIHVAVFPYEPYVVIERSKLRPYNTRTVKSKTRVKLHTNIKQNGSNYAYTRPVTKYRGDTKKIKRRVFRRRGRTSTTENSGNNSYKYMGSEMMTLLTFSQYLNSTMVPVINELDYWGDVWDNWTGNGLMGNLVEDNADIGGAALYIWENMYTYLDMSKPTVRTGITCIVPAPRLAASWLIPLYAYTPTMWLVVMATILTSMLSLYLFSLIYMPHDDRNKLDKTDVFGKVFTCVSKPFIMQNVTNREMIEGKHGRIFMTLVFISALVLSTTYDSGFATIMTIPRYENPINTVEDFVSSGLYWGATQDAWILSIKDTNEIKYQTIVERFVATSETKLRELSLTGEFGFSLERLPNDNYAIGSYIKPDIIQNYHLMTEDFYWTQCVLMTRRNSILLPKLDDFVLRVFEAGLISYWQNEAASSIMDQTVQKAVKYYFHHHAKTIIKLKMAHVQGAFGILCLGYILALILFILEVIYYNLLRKTLIIHQ